MLVSLEQLETSLDGMPVIGRFAYGVRCFEIVLDRLEIRTERSEDILDWLWTFVSTDDVGRWYHERHRFVPSSWGEMAPLVNAAKNLMGVGRREWCERLYSLLLDVVEVGLGNLYTQIDDSHTRPHVLSIARFMINHSFSAPDPARFELSFSENRTWGDAVPMCVFWPGFFGTVPDAVSVLCREIRADDRYRRRAAAFAFRATSPGNLDVCESLLHGLQDTDEMVRARSANSLRFVAPPVDRVLPALEAALRDSSALVRNRSANTLGHLGCAAAMSSLSALLNDPDLSVRIEGVQALKRIGRCSTDTVAALSAAFDDRSQPSDVRRRIATCLLNYCAEFPEARPVVISALNDPDPDVRYVAANAFGMPKCLEHAREWVPAVVDALARLLATGGPKEQNAAVYALSKMGSAAQRALPALNCLLQTAQPGFDLKVSAAIKAIQQKNI